MADKHQSLRTWKAINGPIKNHELFTHTVKRRKKKDFSNEFIRLTFSERERERGDDNG
jgi:hypothetical protein